MLSEKAARQKTKIEETIVGNKRCAPRVTHIWTLGCLGGELRQGNHGSSERYAHMKNLKNCEICKVITKLGLPRAVHDLWFCIDKQLPPGRNCAAQGIVHQLSDFRPRRGGARVSSPCRYNGGHSLPRFRRFCRQVFADTSQTVPSKSTACENARSFLDRLLTQKECDGASRNPSHYLG